MSDALPTLMPVPEPAAMAADGHRLAGSRSVAFTRCRRYPDLADVPVSDTDIRPFTQARPDLCGLPLDTPRIMGILNVTPDSFSDGGDLRRVADVVDTARHMQADILDIGGESTRPGAEEVSVREEWDRVVPAITAIREAGITTPISIDTRKARVAAAALDAGADMVNDVSAGRFDPDMLPLVAERRVPICLMHSVGDPQTMQENPSYGDVVAEVRDHLAERRAAALEAGIARDAIILDPGIGFGKTLQHNLMLLRALTLYHGFGAPLLLGASRKRFIGTIGQADAAKDRMPGSVAVALHGAGQGVQILRVHDVNETRQALRLHLALNAVEGPQ